jgi:Zn-dependent protease with chaperone function
MRSGVPLWRLDDSLPLAVLAGLRRPRIFIASGILDRLDDGQIEALAAHELAHHEGRDNVKRLLGNGCADPIAWTRTGREISSDWELALEESADARAVSAGVEAGDLAEALVAVARLHRGGPWLEAPAAAFYRGGGLEKRVKRLLDEPAQPESRRRRGRPRLWTGVLVVAAVWMLAVIGLSRPVHALIERGVQAGTSANYEPW